MNMIRGHHPFLVTVFLAIVFPFKKGILGLDVLGMVYRMLIHSH